MRLPNGTPSASDLYGIIRVNDDNLEDAYNRYSNGFTINVGDLSVEETGTVTRSFDMTVRIPTTASYNMYYMRAYGSPVNTNGIIFYCLPMVNTKTLTEMIMTIIVMICRSSSFVNILMKTELSILQKQMIL